MHTVLRDVQYAVRQLRRAPGFTITAVLTLALGLGATTAIFSLIYSTMLKTMPVEHAAKLYFIGPEPTCCNWGGMQEDKWALFSYDQYRYFRDHTPGFESLAAFEAGRTALLTRRVGDPRTPETVNGRFVSGNEFSTFGVPMALGRPILSTDDVDAASPVAVLSYRAWERRYGKDPGVLNASFAMNGVVVTVVGITAPEYKGEIVQSDPPEAWLPLHQAAKFDGSTGASARINRLHSGWLDLVGRVAPGASPEALQSQVIVELRQWLHAHASEFAPPERAQIDRQTTRLISARTGVNEIGDEYGQGLKLLMAAACFVLLIVCANVANLLLVRATAERQTMAVRIALGASRAQLLRQALVASALLSLAGSAGALLIAYAVARSVLGLAFRGAQYVPVDVHLSLPVLAFAMLVALLTSLLFGVGPALIATRTDPASAIRGTARTTKDTNSAPQRVLVVLQAALSVVLLCAAGLLLRSLNNLQKQDFGFQTADRYILGIDPFLAGYKPDQLDDLYRKLHARLMAIPGAGAAGLALYTPMAHNNWAEGVFLPGQPDPQPGNSWYIASWTRVNPAYFPANGARLRSGRFITEADDVNSRKVAVGHGGQPDLCHSLLQRKLRPGPALRAGAGAAQPVRDRRSGGGHQVPEPGSAGAPHVLPAVCPAHRLCQARLRRDGGHDPLRGPGSALPA